MLTELKTFLAVARHGTFAAAGDRVGLTQSAVSGQMRRLEEKLGKPLFARTGRSAELNADGRLLLSRAGALLEMAEGLLAPEDPGSRTGSLAVGAIASVHLALLRQVLPDFLAEFPAMRTRVVPGTSMELLDRLDGGELDLALVIQPGFGLPPGLRWRPLLRERFVLVAPPGWPPESPAGMLGTRPFLRYNRMSFGGRQVERYLEAGRIAVRDWAELDDIPTILALVADGRGVSIVPEAAAYRAELAQVRIIGLDPPGPFREIGIIHPAAPPGAGTDPAGRFMALCAGTAAGLPGGGISSG
ncbi:LysR family transcriptional regulator [Mangrovicoccus sp. HB161399]|uniref:LysR family transcriptional regulator n=1 Tax=Mangrovicoccus sp. HB161399 TaxID=2720392 RepID=UPI001553F0C1|nr:LysR family transcriptional regulator [Mangrovicoccus sp. HB161399]